MPALPLHLKIPSLPHLPPGIYETLLTRGLERVLGELHAHGGQPTIEDLDPAEAPQALARFVHDPVKPLPDSLPKPTGRATSSS